VNNEFNTPKVELRPGFSFSMLQSFSCGKAVSSCRLEQAPRRYGHLKEF
jgi:hypothetical protein